MKRLLYVIVFSVMCFGETVFAETEDDIIASYPFENMVSSLDDEETANIRHTIAACADIMSFDRGDYDYDTLFKYVLYTHDNFRILTDIEPQSGNSSSFGYNNVYLVSADFIDAVMESVFLITPEKPPVEDLLSRGFCYNNGYYYYTGGFDTYFSTQIRDIKGVYEPRENLVYVVFTDVYSENNTDTLEYSFAVLEKSASGYSLVRLGMGAGPLSAQELVSLAAPAETAAPLNIEEQTQGVPVSAVILIGAGLVVFIFAVIILIRLLKKK